MVNSTFNEPQSHWPKNSTNQNGSSFNNITKTDRCTKYDGRDLEAGAPDTGYHGTFLWSTAVQSFILSGTGWGGFVMIFIGGILTDRFGARPIYIVSMVTYCVFTALIPILAKHGYAGLIVIRIIHGLVGVSGFPALLVVACKWFPVKERGILMSIGLTGSSIGGLVIFGIGGFFCKSSAGWEGLMYLISAVTFVCIVCWIFLYSDEVNGSRFISVEEAAYIKRNRGVQSATKSLAQVPWKSMLTCLPVWAIMWVTFSQYYVYYFIASYMPTYYKEVLNINVATSGIFSAIPMLVQAVSRLVSGPMSDFVERYVSTNTSVRIFTVISGYGSSICVLMATFFSCETYWGAVLFLSLAYFFHGFIIGGFLKSVPYIAPMYTGTVSGLAQELNYLSNLLVPYISAALISGGTDADWHYAFYVVTAVGLAGSTFFIIFGSTDLQPWSQLAQEDPRKDSIYTVDGEMVDFKQHKMSVIHRESVCSQIAFLRF